MKFNRQPELHLVKQTQQSLLVAIPKAHLSKTLPLLEPKVIKQFNVTADNDQLLVNLEATRDARFYMVHGETAQLEISIRLVKQPRVEEAPQSQSKTVKPQRRAAISTVENLKNNTHVVPNAGGSAEEVDITAIGGNVSVAVTPEKTIEVKTIRHLTDLQAVTKARMLLRNKEVNKAQALLLKQLKNQPYAAKKPSFACKSLHDLRG